MARSLHGKYLWIWEVAQTACGNPTLIAELGKKLGMTGFIIKAHDGTTVWPQFAQVVGPLKKAGLAVIAWGYVYGVDPIAETRAAQVGIDAGADAYIIDAESGYEGKPEAARTLASALRLRNRKLTIGYAPFAFPSEHPTFPYAEFSTYCDVCLPQIYWADFVMPVLHATEKCYAELGHYGLPIAPIGQSYGASTQQEIEQFGVITRSKEATAISFWDAQSASSRQLQAIKCITLHTNKGIG